MSLHHSSIDQQLSEAVERGDCAGAENAIDSGGNVNLVDYYRKSLVWRAASLDRPGYPHEEMLDLLLANGADINIRDSHFATPLITVTKNLFSDIGFPPDHYDPLMRVLGRGADPNLINIHGYSAMTTAVAGYRYQKTNYRRNSLSHELLKEVLTLLSDHGARIDVGFTIVMYAAQHGWVKLLKAFVPQASDIDAAFILGRTPLHLAAGNGYAGAVSYLLSQGASPAIRDATGATPLDLAQAEAQFFHPYDWKFGLAEYDVVVAALTDAG